VYLCVSVCMHVRDAALTLGVGGCSGIIGPVWARSWVAGVPGCLRPGPHLSRRGRLSRACAYQCGVVRGDVSPEAVVRRCTGWEAELRPCGCRPGVECGAVMCCSRCGRDGGAAAGGEAHAGHGAVAVRPNRGSHARGGARTPHGLPRRRVEAGDEGGL
jgi:hypothetical protein